jgi:integrase
LLEGLINPKIVSERLGHSKVDMTLNAYSHVLPQMQKEAAKKLDETLFIK